MGNNLREIDPCVRVGSCSRGHGHPPPPFRSAAAPQEEYEGTENARKAEAGVDYRKFLKSHGFLHVELGLRSTAPAPAPEGGPWPGPSPPPRDSRAMPQETAGTFPVAFPHCVLPSAGPRVESGPLGPIAPLHPVPSPWGLKGQAFAR